MTSALTTALASLLSQRAGAWTGTATEIQIALAAELPDDLRTLDASRFSLASALRRIRWPPPASRCSRPTVAGVPVGSGLCERDRAF